MQTSNQRTQNNNFPLTRLNPFGAFLSESLPHSGQHAPRAFSPPCLLETWSPCSRPFAILPVSAVSDAQKLATGNFLHVRAALSLLLSQQFLPLRGFLRRLRRHLSEAKPPRAEHQTVLGSSSLRAIPDCPPNCGESSACWSCQIPDSAALSCAPPCMPANAHSHPP